MFVLSKSVLTFFKAPLSRREIYGRYVRIRNGKVLNRETKPKLSNGETNAVCKEITGTGDRQILQSYSKNLTTLAIKYLRFSFCCKKNKDNILIYSEICLRTSK